MINDAATHARTTRNSTRLRDRQIYRFKSPALAFAFADGASRHKAMGVMLGDDGRFWVCLLATCARLEKAGYEWAPR